MSPAPGGLVLIVASLLTVGVIMVTSAGLTIETAEPVTLTSVLLGRHAAHAALAMAALAGAAMLPADRMRRAAWVPWLGAACVCLLLCVYVPGLGREVNGARRWLDLGFVTFQPSEVVKWTMPLLLAWYAAGRPGAMSRFVPGFALPVAFVALVCGLIALEDLGTAVLIAAVGVAVLLAAGARPLHAALLAPAGLAAVAAAIVFSPYRVDRLRAFLDPAQDPQGIGYHLLHSLGTIAGGGVLGRGLGNGVRKFGYLPEDTTDFIFAIICEELGLLGAAAVIGLFAALVACGWAIIRRLEDPFDRLLGLGIVLTVGGQALLNLAVVTGLAPTKGIALPLVSAGGTGWVLTAFSLGVLLALDRDAQRRPAAADPRAARHPVFREC